MSERHKLQMSKWYYETKCKELEEERKQLRKDIDQLNMLLKVKIDKIRSDVK